MKEMEDEGNDGKDLRYNYSTAIIGDKAMWHS